jgi:hypothetical protein
MPEDTTPPTVPEDAHKVMGGPGSPAREQQADEARREQLSALAAAVAASTDPSQSRPYDPATTHPSTLHGARDRIRQDDQLDPEAIIELTIRPGRPETWVDVPVSGGADALRVALAESGSTGAGINLVATHSEAVDRTLVALLQAGTTPARLVRVERRSPA